MCVRCDEEAVRSANEAYDAAVRAARSAAQKAYEEAYDAAVRPAQKAYEEAQRALVAGGAT